MSEWPPVRFKEGTLRCDIAHLDGQKLYTTPPQRTWVGLTREEAKEICLANRPYVVDMVIALEAELKKRNGFTDEENT